MKMISYFPVIYNLISHLLYQKQVKLETLNFIYINQNLPVIIALYYWMMLHFSYTENDIGVLAEHSFFGGPDC